MDAYIFSCLLLLLLLALFLVTVLRLLSGEGSSTRSFTFTQSRHLARHQSSYDLRIHNFQRNWERTFHCNRLRSCWQAKKI